LGTGMHRYQLSQAKVRFAAVIAERTRIAREIHDTVMQGMTGISAQLEAVSAMLRASPAAAETHLDRVRVQARHVVDEARRSIWDLRPGTLDQGGLVAAIKQSAQSLIEQRPIRLKVRATGNFRSLSEKLETTLLRISQEAIANAVRHAGPSEITVSLRFDAQDVELSVRDDGRGFAATSALARGEHFGLLGMRERADEIGGQLRVDSTPGAGTKIEIRIPMGPEKQAVGSK